MYDRSVSPPRLPASVPDVSDARSEWLLLETLRGLRVHALTATPHQIVEDLSLGQMLLARLGTPALRHEGEGFIEAMVAMLRCRTEPITRHP